MPTQPLSGALENHSNDLRWEEVLNRLLSDSPELAAARADVERARCALSRACAERIPNVTVQTSVHQDNATGDAVAGVEVGLRLPLFNRNQGNIAAANAELAAADRNVERTELSLHKRLAERFQRYSIARNQVEKYRQDILPDAKTTLDLMSKGYQQGEFGYLEMLTAQRTFFQSNLAYLESLRQLRSAAAEIDGLLLGNSLEGGQ